jgi:hypothetical protein
VALIPYQPQNLTAEQADGNILLTWTGSLGATYYQIQRSLDGVNFTNLATSNSNQYVDSYPSVTVGVQYYYQVAGVNGNGTSVYSAIVSMVAAPPSEMSLGELRLRCQQTADRVGSNFVAITEWNAFIRLAMYELYDILITSSEDYFASNTVFINTDGTTANYPLPDGATNYIGGGYPSALSGSPAKAFYKLAGIDLNLNTSTITPSRVALLRFDFIKRNQYVYPNSTSTIYGVYNMRYRLMGDGDQQILNIIPTPAGNQTLLVWYSPKLPALLKDTDLTTIGYSGWLRYVIARTAKYALDKEEGTDTSTLTEELLFLKTRIEQAAQNRDQGQADTISETRQDAIYGGTGFAGGSSNGGWLIALLSPALAQHNIGNHLLAHSIFSGQLGLGYITLLLSFAYLLYKNPGEFGGGIFLARKASAKAAIVLSSFRNFISHIIKWRAEE